MGALADHAAHYRLSRRAHRRLGPHWRRPARQPPAGVDRRNVDRKSAAPVCRNRDRNRDWARGLADERLALARRSRFLRFAGDFSAARALGARVVIAVNMDADRFGRGTTIASHGATLTDAPPTQPAEHARNGFARLRGMFTAERALKRQIISGDSRPSFSTVMVESFNIMQDRLTRMRLAGDPPDVHITPRIGHIGWLDFHRAAESITVGRAATEKAIDSITESIADLS